MQDCTIAKSWFKNYECHVECVWCCAAAWKWHFPWSSCTQNEFGNLFIIGTLCLRRNLWKSITVAFRDVRIIRLLSNGLLSFISIFNGWQHKERIRIGLNTEMRKPVVAGGLVISRLSLDLHLNLNRLFAASCDPDLNPVASWYFGPYPTVCFLYVARVSEATYARIAKDTAIVKRRNLP